MHPRKRLGIILKNQNIHVKNVIHLQSNIGEGQTIFRPSIQDILGKTTVHSDDATGMGEDAHEHTLDMHIPSPTAKNMKIKASPGGPHIKF